MTLTEQELAQIENALVHARIAMSEVNRTGGSRMGTTYYGVIEMVVDALAILRKED